MEKGVRKRDNTIINSRMLAKKPSGTAVASKDLIPKDLINESTSPNKPKSKRNISHACVNCQKKKCKCIPIENPTFPGKPFCETCRQLNKPLCEFKNQKKRGPSASDNAQHEHLSSMIKPDDITIIKGVLNKHKTKGMVSKDPHGMPATRTNPLTASIPAFTKPLINKAFENEWIHGEDRKTLQREKSTEKLFEYLLYGYSDLQTPPQNDNKRKVRDLLNTLKKKTVDDIYDDVVALETLLADYLSK